MGKQVLKRSEKIVVPVCMQEEAPRRFIGDLPKNVHLNRTSRLEEVLAYYYMQKAGIVFDHNEQVTIGDCKNAPDIVSGNIGVEVATRGYKESCPEYGTVWNFTPTKYSHVNNPTSDYLLEETLLRKQAGIHKYGNRKKSLFITSIIPSHKQQLKEAQSTLAYLQRMERNHYENLICKLDKGLFLVDEKNIERFDVPEHEYDLSGYQEICDYILTKQLQMKEAKRRRKPNEPVYYSGAAFDDRATMLR